MINGFLLILLAVMCSSLARTFQRAADELPIGFAHGCCQGAVLGFALGGILSLVFGIIKMALAIGGPSL